MKKGSIGFISALSLLVLLASCGSAASSSSSPSSGSSFSSSSSESADGSSSGTSSSSQHKDGLYFDANDISLFGSATPAGSAHYDSDKDCAVIWNTDASLDNYGGVCTPVMELDFSKAVYFEIGIVDVFTEYIIKLSVSGENENFYVLADESGKGTISINVVDAMLCDKFRQRNTQPDPGYQSGWKYSGQKVKCSFFILAKGPDGERQTAELDVSYININNDLEAVKGVNVSSAGLLDGRISALKGSESVTLNASVSPSSIPNQTVVFQSSDPSVAAVDDSGVVSFVGVGQALVYCKSALDQSKFTAITIDVLSGYENPADMKAALDTLIEGHDEETLSLFNDLFATSWSESSVELSFEAITAIQTHQEDGMPVIENYFDPLVSSMVAEAESHKADGKAYLLLDNGLKTSYTSYRLIGSELAKETATGSRKCEYASFSGSWKRSGGYTEKTIILSADGKLFKYSYDLRGANHIGSYSPADFMDDGQWVVPDRTKQSEDATINALSPASRSVSDGKLTLKQNKYPESKYCFGGIVSEPLSSEKGLEVQTIVDIDSVNQKNDYIKTMWEIRIIYYKEDGKTPVSSTPIKVTSGNSSGLFVHSFIPAYADYRLYFVVNGSDIGAQFSDATVIANSMKLYSVGE